MSNTTRTQIPAEVSNVYSKALLMRVTPYFVYTKWAQIKDIPQNAGTKTIKFRRYSSVAAAVTPLSEGVTPAGSQLAVTDITVDVEQYGDFVTVTDIVDFQSADPVLVEAAEVLGDQALDTFDLLTRDVLAGGTNVQYAGGKTARNQVTSSDKFAIADVMKIVRTLKNANAKKITGMVDPSNGYNTTPINACFVGIVHPNTVYDMKQLSAVGSIKWVPVEQYPQTRAMMENEVGAIDEVRFVETTNGKVFTGLGSGSIDVYGTIILAKEAYGITRISGKSLENIVKPLGAGEDPLNQRATSGWKGTFAAKILNNAFIVRYEHAISA
jgi:N4-gp56 family major capsid protein